MPSLPALLLARCRLDPGLMGWQGCFGSSGAYSAERQQAVWRCARAAAAKAGEWSGGPVGGAVLGGFGYHRRTSLCPVPDCHDPGMALCWTHQSPTLVAVMQECADGDDSCSDGQLPACSTTVTALAADGEEEGSSKLEEQPEAAADCPPGDIQDVPRCGGQERAGVGRPLCALPAMLPGCWFVIQLSLQSHALEGVWLFLPACLPAYLPAASLPGLQLGQEVQCQDCGQGGGAGAGSQQQGTGGGGQRERGAVSGGALRLRGGTGTPGGCAVDGETRGLAAADTAATIQQQCGCCFTRWPGRWPFSQPRYWWYFMVLQV